MSEQTLFDEDGHIFLWKLFFGALKIVLVLLVLISGALILAQSTVAPVSVRLLSAYGMEYAVEKLKPVRPFFPEPYVVHID